MGGLYYVCPDIWIRTRVFLESCFKCLGVSVTLSQGCRPDMILMMNLANVNCRQITARVAWGYGQDPLVGSRSANLLCLESVSTAKRACRAKPGISV